MNLPSSVCHELSRAHTLTPSRSEELSEDENTSATDNISNGLGKDASNSVITATEGAKTRSITRKLRSGDAGSAACPMTSFGKVQAHYMSRLDIYARPGQVQSCKRQNPVLKFCS